MINNRNEYLQMECAERNINIDFLRGFVMLLLPPIPFVYWNCTYYDWSISDAIIDGNKWVSCGGAN